MQPENPQPIVATAEPPTELAAVPTLPNKQPAPQPVVGAVLTPDQEAKLAPPKPKMSRNKKLIAIGAPCLAVLLGLGGVFGLYLPNTPENVWKTAMGRTNMAVEKVVASVASPGKLESYASSEITGEFEANVMGETYSGKLNTRYDEAMSDSGLSVEFPGEAGGKQSLNASLITATAKDATLPDVYFKVKGVSALGLDLFVPGISEYDDKWIVASSDYLSTLSDEFVTEAAKEEKQPTAADISEVSIAATDVIRDYMFTTDPEKAVLKNDGFIDKQEIDGQTMYHYKVSINQANATAMCKSLIDAVYKTKAYKSFTGDKDEQISKDIADAQKDCDRDAKDAVKDAGAMEAWVDGKYKLIHKVRVYEPKSTTSYVDVGQNYTGGDDFALFAHYVDTKEKIDADMRLKVNTETNVTTFSVEYDGGDSGDGSLTITAKPLTAKVQVTIPTNAIPIQDVMAAMEAASEARYSQYNADFEQSRQEMEAYEYYSNNRGSMEGYDGYIPPELQES